MDEQALEAAAKARLRKINEKAGGWSLLVGVSVFLYLMIFVEDEGTPASIALPAKGILAFLAMGITSFAIKGSMTPKRDPAIDAIKAEMRSKAQR